ncbi:hypothetical protein D9758_004117 [Tetrapyrgos nigripes]|uniref:Decapping nuclease n=1 Tax=Tetrapyrgos nigripes TaxID=182062 RepID=A0A8H5LVR4_9AGAR|nr:hypothetical protein D9758_004117 [Tetrapyrgos nigripes]
MLRHSRQSLHNGALHPRTFRHHSTTSNRETPENSHFLPLEHAPFLAHVRMTPPRQVACYSRVDFNVYNYNENSSLTRFEKPKLGPIALPARLISRKRMTELHRPERVDQLLQACLGTEKGKKALLEADVIAPRNVIYKLMHGLKVSLNVSYTAGRLFLEEHEEKILYKLPRPRLVAEYCMRFKCRSPYYQPPNSYPEDVREWNAVVQRNIGGLNTLMSAHVHCVKDKYTASPDCYFELHSRRVGSSNTYPFHLQKNDVKDLAAWYLRMHLIGTPELCLGLRSPDNKRLVEMHIIPTDELPSIINDFQRSQNWPNWQPDGYITRAFRTLYLLRDWAQEAVDSLQMKPVKGQKNDEMVWRVERLRHSDRGIYVRELSREEKDRLWAVRDRPLWEGLGQTLPRRHGIIDRASLRDLRQLDRETLDSVEPAAPLKAAVGTGKYIFRLLLRVDKTERPLPGDSVTLNLAVDPRQLEFVVFVFPGKTTLPAGCLWSYRVWLRTNQVDHRLFGDDELWIAKDPDFSCITDASFARLRNVSTTSQTYEAIVGRAKINFIVR